MTDDAQRIIDRIDGLTISTEKSFVEVRERLTRIETKIDVIRYDVNDVRGMLTNHEARIAALERKLLQST